MTTKDIWGPLMWKELHEASIHKSLSGFLQFIGPYGKRIPCADCQRHFKQYLYEHPIYQGVNPVKWGIDLHNSVNERLGKPVLSYSEAYSKIGYSDTNYYFYIFIVLIFLPIFIRKYALSRK
jgi:hypothetical protein